MKLINRDYKRPSKELVEAYREVAVATAHEAMGRKYYIDSSIRPLYDGMKVCGPALTCQCPEMDNLTLHAALHIAEPGDVIVCTLGDYKEQGPFGDCLATSAMIISPIKSGICGNFCLNCSVVFILPPPRNLPTRS